VPSRVSRRIALVVAGLVTVTVTGCSNADATPLPYCAREGSGLIAAQSVPGAELVPCFDSLPAGWEVATVEIDQDRTQVTLDSDRAGVGAARLRFEDDCDLGAAVEVPSDREGAEQFEFIEQVEPGFAGQRYYVFPGGCAWWDFDFDDDASAALSIELGDQVSLITRQAINENIRRDFIDEEL
jgi:hypothetical protein